MPSTGPRDLLMPVTDDHAARLIEIEALRQITDNLKGLRDEIKEARSDVSDVRERVIRIESNQLDRQVERNTETIGKLQERIDALERDKDRRDGAVSAWDWLFKNWPGVIGFFALIMLILALTGKLPK